MNRSLYKRINRGIERLPLKYIEKILLLVKSEWISKERKGNGPEFKRNSNANKVFGKHNNESIFNKESELQTPYSNPIDYKVYLKTLDETKYKEEEDRRIMLYKVWNENNKTKSFNVGKIYMKRELSFRKFIKYSVLSKINVWRNGSYNDLRVAKGVSYASRILNTI